MGSRSLVRDLPSSYSVFLLRVKAIWKLMFPSAHPQPDTGHLPLQSQCILPKICRGGQITETKSLQDGNPGFFMFNKAGVSWNLYFVCTVSSISSAAVRNPPTPEAHAQATCYECKFSANHFCNKIQKQGLQMV